MSDRDWCKDCKHCGEPVHIAGASGVMSVCNYPVPFWALPPAFLYLDRPVTCPTFEAKVE